MQEKSTFKFPISLLVLDLIGTLLIVLGVIEWKGVVHFIPAVYQFENYTFYLIISGCLLMYPLIVYALMT
jgi:hypothetical protein